ncbi:hypothetical protein WICMUC_001220 [Wickerhamomyces mucosus]|uniref:Uncharacterized protein n=1 Tax=Wickerhamomyces mucosus TaxID=1378264 RepID=A0A9P8THN6_9ASCO|nr:hypothetical protein WICMUC_001220 [Wickerhamomyces mucosus]
MKSQSLISVSEGLRVGKKHQLEGNYFHLSILPVQVEVGFEVELGIAIMVGIMVGSAAAPVYPLAGVEMLNMKGMVILAKETMSILERMFAASDETEGQFVGI